MLWLVLRVVFLVAKWRIRPLAKGTVGMVVDKTMAKVFLFTLKLGLPRQETLPLLAKLRHVYCPASRMFFVIDNSPRLILFD